MILRKIKEKNGRDCLLVCGHTVKSAGKYSAKCKKCEENETQLVKSRDGYYTFRTTETDCKECMGKISHKCKWEFMPRLAVLINYKDILCDGCKDIIGLKKVEYIEK